MKSYSILKTSLNNSTVLLKANVDAKWLGLGEGSLELYSLCRVNIQSYISYLISPYYSYIFKIYLKAYTDHTSKRIITKPS